jgi:cell division protein FtsZ
MKFELPKDNSSIIKVIGVGGGGSNAVNHMYRQGIKGVDFIVCNTDLQALDISPVPMKIQLGIDSTEGRGAGSIPEVGKNAAIENLEELREILSNNTKMLFVTAGMGGGTGTGAAPVIASLAKEMGILTVGIVTVPFVFEGRKRRQQADDGIERMRQSVDTLLIINNDKLREMFGNLTLGNAFSQADDVLTTAAKGIAEVISVTGAINVDFNDVNTVMRDSGYAIMGSAQAEGEDRAITAVQKALSSPLLNDNNIAGAKYVLLNITYGDNEVLMDEIADITDYIQDEAGSTADVIWGHGYDETMGNKISVTIIATGFNATPDVGLSPRTAEKVKVSLDEERPTMITQPIERPITSPVENSINLFSAAPVVPNVSFEAEPFIVQKSEPTSTVETPLVSDSIVETPSVETPSVVAEVLTSSNDIVSSISQDELPTSTNVNEDITTEWEIKSTPSSFNEPVQFNAPKEEESTIKRSWLDDASENKVDTTNESKNESSSNGIIRYNLLDEEEEVDTTASNNTIVASTEEESGITYSTTNSSSQPSVENNADLTRQRIDRIRQNSLRMRTQNGLNELENEPAYLRRNIQLEETKLSSHSNLSRFSLNESEDENGNKKTGLSGNNSFLHDNVD